jgi:hypothetical protein
MEKLDLTLNLDEIIEEVRQQESEGLVMCGSTVLSFIKDRTAGNIVDTVNLLAEIEDRIKNIETYVYYPSGCTQSNTFYNGAMEALSGLAKWVKDNT